MISKECQEVLTEIQNWAAELAGLCDNLDDDFDLEQSRASFKFFSRPPDILRTRTFRANGVLSEWVCDADSDPDLRLLYLHGGGYISGDLDTTVPFSELLSKATGCCVLAIEYSLAPEYPFPHALNDSVNAFQWLFHNGPEGPGPAKGVFIAGDSAGGGLTLSTLLKLRDEIGILPDAAVTFSALTDLSFGGDSLKTRVDLDPVLNENFLRFCSNAYSAGADPKDPYISPLFADPAGLPPLFMQVGGREILLDDTLRFADQAKASGVSMALDVWPEMFHSWQLFAPRVPEARAALERVGSYIKGFSTG